MITIDGEEYYGWASQSKVDYMRELVKDFKPKIFVEIGVYGGASFIPIAKLMRELHRDNECYAIDPWDMDQNLLEVADADKEWWAKNPDLNPAKESFIKKLEENNLAEVRVLELNSDEASNWFDIDEIDFLHIDGGHDYQAIIDCYNYLPRVKSGGIIVMDDVNWRHKGQETVKLAINYLLDRGCRMMDERENFATLMKF
jgi:predicted O-methyltransferase YrrM